MHNKKEDIEEWKNRLVGKVILSDTETTTQSEDKYVREKDLPAQKRIVDPDSFMTMDFQPNRLNIKVTNARKVIDVYYG
ncbi:hypothetical protein BDB01DRAFT_792891 [Pilobolus umbonatus]|nr:hypothetical protein BDB01DRAFT_792891 [Pilobolus umbonatus]